MPVDPERALGALLPSTTVTWDEDRVILYQLGIGAGTPATNPGELAYVYEASLKVLPSFATIPARSSMLGVQQVDGISFDPVLLVHGDQQVDVHRPLPVSATVSQTGRIDLIFHKVDLHFWGLIHPDQPESIKIGCQWPAFR